MKKLYFTLILFLSLMATNTLLAQYATLPVTAVSFPKEVLPIDAGRIEFYARLSGFSGFIPVGGVAPNFFQIAAAMEEGDAFNHFTYHAGFNANDGAGNGGLVGRVGNTFLTGSGLFNGWTYEDVLGFGEVEDWHHYVFQWNKNGIPGVDNGQQVLAIYVDGVLNSGRWSIADGMPGTFPPFILCPTLNLITIQTPGTLSGEIAIDEFKIFDGQGNLILHNTLGSQSEVENSVVGLNGSYNGGGNAHFVPGISGNAVMATPVYGIGTPTCNGSVELSCPPNQVVPTDEGVCSAVVNDIDPVLIPSNSNTSVGYTLSGATTGSGTGSASDKTFNKGVTIVTYNLLNDLAQTCSFKVTVQDQGVPVITNASVTPSILWPPNHKMRRVTINYTLSDNCSATASLSVTSNEPQKGKDKEDLSVDWQVIDAHHVWLRSERLGKGNGRVYSILITAIDASGNKSTETVTVTVPHDQSDKSKGNKEDTINELKVKVIPNPSPNNFTLQLQSHSNKPLTIKVLNSFGKLVEARSNVAANGTIQLGSSYPPGIYYAEVEQAGKKIMVKMVKSGE